MLIVTRASRARARCAMKWEAVTFDVQACQHGPEARVTGMWSESRVGDSGMEGADASEQVHGVDRSGFGHRGGGVGLRERANPEDPARAGEPAVERCAGE